LNNKPVILIFPFNLMSHYLRCLTLAEHLKPHYDIRFATSPNYEEFIQQAGFATFPYVDFDANEILSQSQEFRFDWLEKKTLKDHFEQQKYILQKHLPVAVIGDNSFTLKMAAESCNVKFIALMNAYMTQYYQPGRKLTRKHPKAALMERLPSKLYWYFINRIERYHFKYIHTPYKHIRQENELEQVASYADEMAGDITLLCDLPELFPQKDLPSTFHFIGPLFFTPPSSCILPKWELPDSNKKNIVVSMGSSGDYTLVRWLNDPRFAEYNVIVTGDKNNILHGDHIYSYTFVPLREIMPHTDLLICHGGNGTVYEALKEGVPVLCLPNIFEQEWNEYAIIKNGLGDTLSDVKGVSELHAKIKLWDNLKQTNNLRTVREQIHQFSPICSLKQIFADSLF